jgi:hypothetical protein
MTTKPLFDEFPGWGFAEQLTQASHFASRETAGNNAVEAL